MPANEYYDSSGVPATSTKALSSTMRAEFNAIETGFNKLAVLSGNSNLPVFVNTGGTGQEAVSIATALTRFGLPTNLATLTLPASVTISAFGATIIDDADAAAVRTTLGLVIGTNVQAYDAFLGSISALGTAADKIIYTTGVNTAAETALTAFARTILDDANAAAVIATLGLDADIATFTLPASTTISAFAKTVLDDADAATALGTLGLTATAAEINTACDGVLATYAEINKACDLTSNGFFTSGGVRKLLFYENIAPTGWTIQNTLDDKLIFVTKGSVAGGQTGGGVHSTGTWTQPNHTHTGPSHTHTGPSHTHSIPALTLATSGTTGNRAIIGNVCIVAGELMLTEAATSTYNKASASTGAGTSGAGGNGATGADGTGATGNGATAATWRPAAYNVIIAALD